MIMLQMTGGMGNQMFTYALYRALGQMGKEVCIEDFTHYDTPEKNCLQTVFHLDYRKADRETYQRLTDSTPDFLHKMKRKLTGRKEKIYQEKDAILFEPEVFQAEDVYMIGYFQSARYFEKAADSLQKDFSFEWSNFPEKAEKLREQMQKETSVSLHIRRGDYMTDKFAGIYGNICTEAYYEAARRYMKEHFGDCRFYLFTDDAEWGRQQESEDTVYVDASEGTGAYVDMALMSCCKHHIIANSSFSWWGAWLDENPDKTVIAPAKWLNISEGKDIYAGLCNCLIDTNGSVQGV